MHMNMKWITVWNPNQTPTDVSDHPVYALTGERQFRHPEIFFSVFFHLWAASYWLVFIGNSWTAIESSSPVQGLSKNTFFVIELFAVVGVNNIKRTRCTLRITISAPFIKLYEAVYQWGDVLSNYWLTQK